MLCESLSVLYEIHDWIKTAAPLYTIVLLFCFHSVFVLKTFSIPFLPTLQYHIVLLLLSGLIVLWKFLDPYNFLFHGLRPPCFESVCILTAHLMHFILQSWHGWAQSLHNRTGWNYRRHRGHAFHRSLSTVSIPRRKGELLLGSCILGATAQCNRWFS